MVTYISGACGTICQVSVHTNPLKLQREKATTKTTIIASAVAWLGDYTFGDRIAMQGVVRQGRRTVLTLLLLASTLYLVFVDG